jgi:hypothetical protein
MKIIKDIIDCYQQKNEIQFIDYCKNYYANEPDNIANALRQILRTDNLNLQLKFLLFKLIGDIKIIKLIDLLLDEINTNQNLNQNHKIYIQAFHSLSQIQPMKSYLLIQETISTLHDHYLLKKFDQEIRFLYSIDPVIFHYDVFYRKKFTQKTIRNSTNYLIDHLEDHLIVDLAKRVNENSELLQNEIWFILKHRPQIQLWEFALDSFFKNLYHCTDYTFLLMSDTLLRTAFLNNKSNWLFQSLIALLPTLPETKKQIMLISLIQLNPEEIIYLLDKQYPSFSLDEKLQVFENFKHIQSENIENFILKTLKTENIKIVLEKIIQLLISHQLLGLLLNTLNEFPQNRKIVLLKIIVDLSPAGIDHFFLNMLNNSYSDDEIILAAEYLIHNYADKYFDSFFKIIKNDGRYDIKSIIFKNITAFSKNNIQKLFLEFCNTDTLLTLPVHEFLTIVEKVTSFIVLESEIEEKIIDKILVLMEEASLDTIKYFLDFFQNYRIKSAKTSLLIVEELRMIQRTLFNTINASDYGRVINSLIQRIQRKVF